MKVRLELTSLLKLPTVLATAQLTSVILRKIYVTYLKRYLTLVICDDDKTFDKRSLEYQNYLIYRQHKPFKVKRQFSEFRNKARAEARKKEQEKLSDVKFVITYNISLPNINEIIQNIFSILQTDEDRKKVSPLNSFTTLHRKGVVLPDILITSFVIVLQLQLIVNLEDKL